MSINLGSIMAKVNSYAKSNEGRTRTQEYLKGIASKGGHTTASGKNIYNEEALYECAVLFIEALKRNASSYDLPQSVMKHINEMTYSDIIYTKDGCSIDLSFAGDLHRDSLENDYKDYGGIDNIVALFNNGYEAGNYVYGWWNNHKPTGEALSRSLYDTDFAWVRSRILRVSLNFIQKTQEDFMAKYSDKYNVVVTIHPDYGVDSI